MRIPLLALPALCLLLTDGPPAASRHPRRRTPGRRCSPSSSGTISRRRSGEIRAQLEKEGFFQKFPPAGTEVVSWYVMMGVGQVVTLRFPPEKLREVNLALEQSAWGAFRTEFYPTYDYRPIAESERKKTR